ncbi:hypothetical protein Tco_1229125 [Tanacetum coccineum]
MDPRDYSLETEKLHRSIKAAIKEEVDHEEQFDFLGVQLNQRIPNRVKARKAGTSSGVARGNIRFLGLNVQRVRQHPPRLVYPILHYKGNQRQIWDPDVAQDFKGAP